jgi:hypothetical protein
MSRRYYITSNRITAWLISGDSLLSIVLLFMLTVGLGLSFVFYQEIYFLLDGKHYSDSGIRRVYGVFLIFLGIYSFQQNINYYLKKKNENINKIDETLRKKIADDRMEEEIRERLTELKQNQASISSE